jgi:hypothetical protein
MSDDDDNPYADRNKLVITDNGGVAFAAIVGSGVVAYVRDIHASLAQVFGRRGIEEALREEQSRVKMAIIALAIAADGEITPDERASIEAYAKKHRLDATDMLDHVAKLSEALRDPKVLHDRITHAAKSLDANERVEVFAAIKNLAHNSGSRAWPPPEDATYRGAMSPTPEALITIFRDALKIESVDQPTT